MSVEFQISKEGNLLISRFKGILADHTLTDYAHRLFHEGHLANHQRDLVFGMFRMWEMKIDDIGYELKVFRNRKEAMTWLLRPFPAPSNQAQLYTPTKK